MLLKQSKMASNFIVSIFNKQWTVKFSKQFSKQMS